MEYQVLKVKKELFRQRCSKVLLWVLVLGPVMAWPTGLLLELDSGWPAAWIGSFNVLISFNFWTYSILASLSVLAFVALHIRSCTVTPEESLRNWNFAFHIFLRPNVVLGILGHTLLGGLTTRCYLGLVSDGNISGLTNVLHRKRCFCDIHFFVVLYGAFLGFIFSFGYYVKCKHLLKFTPIPQSRLMQVKAIFVQLMLTTLSTVLKQTVCFYIPFLVVGCYLRSIITDVLSIHESCTEPIDSLAGIASLRLFWITVVISLALCMTWEGSLYLSNLFLTQVYTFPIETISKVDDTIPLHVAMATSSVPFMQYLAYLDFCLLSQSSKSRRALLFDLSHPGGHPHNWKCVANECLAILHQLTTHLNSAGEPPKPAVNNKVSETLYNEESTEVKLLKRLASDPSTHDHGAEPRGVKAFPLYRIPPAVVVKRWIVRTIRKMGIRLKNCYVAFIQRHFELNRHHLFLGCQPHIWAAEGLSFIAVASLTEDKYGVVQPELSDIITVLCHLQQGLEKQVKWLPARNTKGITHQIDARLKMGLSATVKTALYRIATQFKDHLSSLSLSSECHQILHQYSSYSK